MGFSQELGANQGIPQGKVLVKATHALLRKCGFLDCVLVACGEEVHLQIARCAGSLAFQLSAEIGHYVRAGSKA